MDEPILCTITDGVADVRINRPDKMNALDMAAIDGLLALGEELKADRTLRAVVLSGEGKGFCAGVDFAAFRAMAGDGPPPLAGVMKRDGRDTTRGQQASHVWTEIPVPVIAAIHGPALGAGLQVALGADIRFVAPDAKLGLPETRFGLVPDTTGTQQLPALVGLDVAKELVFSGRTLSGTEAVAIGLATRLSEHPREEALVFAADLAKRSPDALRAAKTLLNMAGRVTLADGFRAEARAVMTLMGTKNQIEAITAHFEQREPCFPDDAMESPAR